MIRKILNVRAPRLRKKSKPVKKVDKKIKDIIKDLKDTLEVQIDPEGVGLAAPQIGKNLQVFAMKPADKIVIVINPEVVFVSKLPNNPKPTKKKSKKIMEGCLSLPHYYGPIEKPNRIKIKYLDENGDPKVSEYKSFAAQIVQHELDHLEGILFIDRLLEQKQPLYELIGDEWEEVKLI
jgi:peptide deformylase